MRPAETETDRAPIRRGARDVVVPAAGWRRRGRAARLRAVGWPADAGYAVAAGAGRPSSWR